LRIQARVSFFIEDDSFGHDFLKEAVAISESLAQAFGSPDEQVQRKNRLKCKMAARSFGKFLASRHY
jgi:hypothetical protein